jgi:hypothetical protein
MFSSGSLIGVRASMTRAWLGALMVLDLGG